MKSVFAVILGVLLLAWPTSAQAAIFDDIQKSLICPACLDDKMTVAACTDSTAEEARLDIERKLAAGQTKDEIISGYVVQYGEIILAVPTKEGFNMLAWVIPPIATVGGSVLVYWVITGWVRNHRGLRNTLAVQGPAIDSVDEERIQEEIRKYL